MLLLFVLRLLMQLLLLAAITSAKLFEKLLLLITSAPIETGINATTRTTKARTSIFPIILPFIFFLLFLQFLSIHFSLQTLTINQFVMAKIVQSPASLYSNTISFLSPLLTIDIANHNTICKTKVIKMPMVTSSKYRKHQLICCNFHQNDRNQEVPKPDFNSLKTQFVTYDYIIMLKNPVFTCIIDNSFIE